MSNRIREYRKARRVTQEALAKAVDVSRQTIISLEKGKYCDSLILAYKIAAYFDAKIEDVFILREDPAILNKKCK